jgi:hypothetical protein
VVSSWFGFRRVEPSELSPDLLRPEARDGQVPTQTNHEEDIAMVGSGSLGKHFGYLNEAQSMGKYTDPDWENSAPAGGRGE